jgi:hypothetical protein
VLACRMRMLFPASTASFLYHCVPTVFCEDATWFACAVAATIAFVRSIQVSHTEVGGHSTGTFQRPKHADYVIGTPTTVVQMCGEDVMYVCKSLRVNICNC